MSEVSASGRSYLASEFRGGGQVETPCVRGQGRQPGGATLRVRSGQERHPASEVRGAQEKPPRT